MKKTLFVMLFAVVWALTGLAATNTADMNWIKLTVKADPDFVSSVQIGTSTDINEGAAYTKMLFSADGVENTAYFSGMYAYCKVTTKESGKYYTTKIYPKDSETAVTVHNNKNVPTNGLIMNFASYNGGVLEVTDNSPAETSYIYVTIEGLPERVSMTMGQNAVTGLQVGENKIEQKNSTVWFKALGGDKFYKLSYNGVEKEPTVDAAEGESVVYNYLFQNTKADDRFYIITEYPDVDYDVEIDCGEYPQFIKSVSVDGEAVTDWSNLKVHAGSRLSLVNDYNNYIVNEFRKNGTAAEGCSETFSCIVEDDLRLEYDVVPLVRDKHVTIKVTSPLSIILPAHETVG